ncbi:hypothetical protein SRRS_07060 [Sporomusa rhizae]|uniref:hypothetical protein n=1 Tax=Sporomusa rhizae TaxID=357999 RepID=UPI00352AFFC8
MKLKTYYRPDQNENPCGNPQTKVIDYLIVPRVGDEVVIDGLEYEVKHVIHDTDENDIVINLKKL